MPNFCTHNLSKIHERKVITLVILGSNVKCFEVLLNKYLYVYANAVYFLFGFVTL